MCRWLAGAAVLALLAGAPVARAETVGRPFTTLSPDRWAWVYRSVERLETAGYFTGSPAGTFNGSRPLTRYEFAAAVERIYRALQTRVQSASESGSLPQEVFSVNQLVGEFSADISDLGYDPADMKRQLRSMSDRLSALDESAAAPQLGGPERLNPSFGSSKFGLKTAINRAGGTTTDIKPDFVKPPTGPIFLPGLTGNVGPARFGFGAQRPDHLDTIPGGLRLEDPAAGLRYRAQLSLPLGQYLLSAFYDRDNGRSDRFGFWDPIFARPYEGIGGALRGSLSSRLDFDLETASLRAQDDLDRLFYIRGGLNYDLGRGYGLGFDIGRSYGSGLMTGDLRGTYYVLSMKRSLGRNTQFNFLYRYFLADPGFGMSGSGSSSDSGALGQVTVRF